MKAILRKSIRFSLALLIPTMMLASCQEDISEPHAGIPPGGVKQSPGSKK